MELRIYLPEPETQLAGTEVVNGLQVLFNAHEANNLRRNACSRRKAQASRKAPDAWLHIFAQLSLPTAFFSYPKQPLARSCTRHARRIVPPLLGGSDLHTGAIRERSNVDVILTNAWAP